MKKRSFLMRTVLYFRPFWWPLFFIMLTFTIGQIIGAFSPFVFGKALDAVIHHNVRLTIIFILLGFLFTFIQAILLSRLREHIELKYLADRIENYFSIISLQKMFSFSVGQHVNEHSGVRQTIVSRGQNSLSDYLNQMLNNILPNILQIVVVLGILAWVEWRVALSAITFLLLYLWVSIRRNKRYFATFDKMRQKRMMHSKLQSELFRNSSLVIAEAQEDRVVEDFSNHGDVFLGVYDDVWTKYDNDTYLSRPLIVLGQYVSLGLGVYLIFTGNLSTGMFVTLFAWLSTVFNNLNQIVNSQRRMLFQEVEIKKYYDLLDITPDIDPNKKGHRIDTLLGKIEFRDVSFAYPYRSSISVEEQDESEEKEFDEHAIEHIDLVIPAKAKVGFVGSSGSGKSTLVNLMRRYYDPSKGEIIVDGIPLTEIDLRWFRSQIGNVEQKIDLFDRSIRDNILFGIQDGHAVSDTEIHKAIKDASLEDFIEKLPEGLNTMIGENGIKVSGGERQRIGIARALIKNPKILIFDEATSALDSVNEKLIHDAINRGSKGRTTIVIAHRLSTIMDADIIFVVDDGKVVASGTHEELQKKSKDYQKLIKHQVLAS